MVVSSGGAEINKVQKFEWNQDCRQWYVLSYSTYSSTTQKQVKMSNISAFFKATVCFPKYVQKIDSVYHVYTKFLPSNTYHNIKTVGAHERRKSADYQFTKSNRFTNKKYSKKAETFFVTKWVTIFL